MAERKTIPVNLHERFKELLFDPEISYEDEVVYEYRAGYEVLTRKTKGGGGSEYRGVFHPNSGCCENSDGSGGPGVCRWCGRTMW